MSMRMLIDARHPEETRVAVAKGNRIEKLLADKTPPERIIEEAYLGSLSRYPTDPEKERLLKVLNEKKETELRPLVEDLFWAILSSKEFLFNH